MRFTVILWNGKVYDVKENSKIDRDEIYTKFVDINGYIQVIGNHDIMEIICNW